MSKSITKSRYINGPVNVVRMEGSVNGIKKVIYLFMDIHDQLQYQTECQDIHSRDIQYYFADMFKKLSSGDKQYDFFLEINTYEVTNQQLKNDNHKNIYLYETRKIFAKIFNYDEKNNKVSMNQLYKNIRLHYIDIRGYYAGSFREDLRALSMMVRDINCYNFTADKLSKITTIFADFAIVINKTIDSLTPNKKKENVTENSKKIIKQLDSDTNFAETIDYLSNKMLHKYHHKNVKNIMAKYISDVVVKYLRDTKTKIENAVKKFNKYKKYIVDSKKANISYYESHANCVKIDGYIRDVSRMTDDIIFDITDIYVAIPDVYFLRRFLDKDYVNNAIVYTGARHSCNYIHFLITKFDFKITNVAYINSDDKNIGNLTEKIKSTPDDFLKINEFIDSFFYRINSVQCSNLAGFPDNFE